MSFWPICDKLNISLFLWLGSPSNYKIIVGEVLNDPITIDIIENALRLCHEMNLGMIGKCEINCIPKKLHHKFTILAIQRELCEDSQSLWYSTIVPSMRPMHVPKCGLGALGQHLTLIWLHHLTLNNFITNKWPIPIHIVMLHVGYEKYIFLL